MAREGATFGVDHVTYFFIEEGVRVTDFIKKINPASIVLLKRKYAHSHCRKKKIHTFSDPKTQVRRSKNIIHVSKKKFRVNERA